MMREVGVGSAARIISALGLHRRDIWPVMKRSREFISRAKGGARQRNARVEAASAANLEPSALAGHMMNLWAWGRMSPQHVQKIMSLMKADLARAREGKLDDHDVNVLASLGSAGTFSGNCHRDLMASINPRAS